jgi:hypothetical protein
MHHNPEKHMVPKIYDQVYCVIINLTNFKHDTQKKNRSEYFNLKAQFCQICFLIYQISTSFILI